MVQVDNHGKITNLYHHCDGCFMGVGFELALKLNDWNYQGLPNEWDSFLRTFPKAYEEVNYPPEKQGDLEYVYLVKIDDKRVTLEGFERGSWRNESRNWKDWKSFLIFRATLRQFDKAYTMTDHFSIPTGIR